MHAHAVRQDGFECLQRFGLAAFDRPPGRKRGAAATGDDSAPFNHQGFPRQNTADVPENSLRSGGELQMYELRDLVRRQLARCQPRRNQRLRLRREGDAVGTLRVIERLDPEGVACKHQTSARRIVQRESVHAAKPIQALLRHVGVERKRRLAIGPGAEPLGTERPAQSPVVVDLAVRHQGGITRALERLIAGLQIDDREPRLHQSGIIGQVPPVAIRSPMGKRAHQAVDGLGGRRPPVRVHHAGDAAHQRKNRSMGAKHSCNTGREMSRGRRS